MIQNIILKFYYYKDYYLYEYYEYIIIQKGETTNNDNKGNIYLEIIWIFSH